MFKKSFIPRMIKMYFVSSKQGYKQGLEKKTQIPASLKFCLSWEVASILEVVKLFYDLVGK